MEVGSKSSPFFLSVDCLKSDYLSPIAVKDRLEQYLLFRFLKRLITTLTRTTGLGDRGKFWGEAYSW